MLRIAIIIGSTRPGRNGEAVARWVYEIARRRGDAEHDPVRRTFTTSGNGKRPGGKTAPAKDPRPAAGRAHLLPAAPVADSSCGIGSSH